MYALSSLLPVDPVYFHITIKTDNMTFQQVLESRSGNDQVLCACARQIWLISTKFTCKISVAHKEGKEFVLVDDLSRALHNTVVFDKALEECNAYSLDRIPSNFSMKNIVCPSAQIMVIVDVLFESVISGYLE